MAILLPDSNIATIEIRGVRFGDRHDYIGTMVADPSTQHQSQHRPYVKIVSNGQMMNDRGERISSDQQGARSRDRADTHIPLSSWIRWQKWNVL